MGNEYETLAIVDPARSARSELNTEEAKLLIDEFKALGAPVFVLTGGDPVKRPDIFELVEYTPTNGVRISLTPSATPLLAHDAISRLKQCGSARLAISLDGPSAKVHDAFRRVPGSYDWTLSAVRWAREIGLPYRSFRSRASIQETVEATEETLQRAREQHKSGQTGSNEQHSNYQNYWVVHSLANFVNEAH